MKCFDSSSRVNLPFREHIQSIYITLTGYGVSENAAYWNPTVIWSGAGYAIVTMLMLRYSTPLWTLIMSCLSLTHKRSDSLLNGKFQYFLLTISKLETNASRLSLIPFKNTFLNPPGGTYQWGAYSQSITYTHWIARKTTKRHMLPQQVASVSSNVHVA